MRALFLVCPLMILAGCSHPPASDDYFPVDAGLHWDYDVELTLSDEKDRYGFRVETLGERPLGSVNYPVRRTSDGTDYYIEKTAEGIFRVAKRSSVELRPAKDDSPRMVLPLPGRVGQAWSNLTQTFTLHRIRPQYEPPNGVAMKFAMNYEIVSKDDAVEVPAGRFEHCIQVQGESQISFYNDAFKGNANVFVVQNEWYCPGVGLVKLERDEPLDTGEFRGGHYSMELRSFGF